MKRLFLIIVSIISILSLLASCTANDAWQDDFYTTGTIYSWNGTAFVPLGTGGGGTNDHSALINLDYASAGHTGFEPAIVYSGNPLQYLDGTGNFSIPAGGAGGNVTSTANLNDNTVIRGDGGLLGVQDSGITIDDFDNLNTNGGDIDAFDINAGNDVNVTNDLDVTDDADIGGQLVVTGNVSAQGNYVLTTDNVNDVPVNGVLDEPISSNWAFDHYIDWTHISKGATVPGSPTEGQLFLHEPTGRKVLLEYDGSNWIPIISLGSMTVYVDKTDGTDSIDKGGAVDAGAFKTVQFAINNIPGLIGGNVNIYINDESYDETVTIKGKSFTGSYTITMYGTLTLHDSITFDGNGVQGATTTKASVHEHGMTTNHYQHQLLKFTNGTNNGTYRVIDSNSNDAGTANIVLAGQALPAQPLTNETANIYTWGTTLNNIVVNTGQKGVVLYDIGFDTSICVSVSSGAELTAYHCTLTIAAGTGLYSSGLGYIWWADGFISCSGSVGTQCQDNSYLALVGGKIYGNSGVSYGNYTSTGGVVAVNGVVIDTHKYGVVLAGGQGQFYASNIYNFIYNCAGGAGIGVYAYTHGYGLNTSFNAYSGNNANETATAASYGYID